MRRLPLMIMAGILLGALASLYIASCGGGGGGGNDIAVDQGPPSGVGTGADSATIFWYPYDANIAVGGGTSVQETSDHGFIVAGSQSSDFSSPLEVFLMKTDAKGATQWKKRIAETGNATANAIRETSDGGYIAAGRAKTAAGGDDVYLLKVDASGNTISGWPKTYGGTGDDVAYAVLPVSDGYIIAGARNVGSSIKAYVIRTDLAGSVVWEKFDYASFCPGGSEFGRDIAATSDGNIVIGGYTGCFGWKGFLLKIDSQGTELWRNAYNTLSTDFETISSIAALPDGFALAGSHGVVSGQPPVTGPLDALVIKTDASGKEIWRQTYGGAGRDEAQGVILTQDGNYMILGTTQSYGGQISANADGDFQLEDLLLIKVDTNGNTLWQKVKGNRPTVSDHGGAICAVSDGGFAVTGSSDGNVLLVKLDKNGDTINLGETDLTISVPGTTGTIKFNNAIEVAAAAVSGLTKPRQLGSTALDLLIARLKNDPVTNFCSTGTYTFNPLPASPLQAGTSFDVTFTGCLTGQATINGSLTITLNGVPGDPLLPNYTLQTTLNSINLTIADAVGTSTMAGGMRFQRVAAGGTFTELARSIDTPVQQAFTWSESSATINRTHAIGPFSVSSTVTNTSFSLGSTTDTLTVDSGLGPLVVTVAQPLQGGALVTAPTSGAFKVVATDGSQLTVTVTNGVAASAVDTNGDGSVDGTISAPWDALD